VCNPVSSVAICHPIWALCSSAHAYSYLFSTDLRKDHWNRVGLPLLLIRVRSRIYSGSGTTSLRQEEPILWPTCIRAPGPPAVEPASLTPPPLTAAIFWRSATLGDAGGVDLFLLLFKETYSDNYQNPPRATCGWDRLITRVNISFE
jgi:hypothetical protein